MENAVFQPTILAEVRFRSKLLRCIGAFLLATVVWDGFGQFFQKLNERGFLGLAADFKPTWVMWGQGCWPNILHLIVLIVFAGVFGALTSYNQKVCKLLR